MIPKVVHLPTKPMVNMVLEIIDQLDEDDFSQVAESVKKHSRKRACEAWDRMRHSARKAGLRKKDFEEAIQLVRQRKREIRATTTRRS